MSIYVQYRYGTTTEHNTFTGGAQELTIDTTKNVVVVHNGSTVGGFPMLRQDLNNTLTYATTTKNVLPVPVAETNFARYYHQVLNADGVWRAQTAKILTVTGTTYTLGANTGTYVGGTVSGDIYDAEAYIRFTNAAAKTVTIPTTTTAAFPVGTTISGVSTGAGQLTLVPASTVTLNGGTANILLRAATYVSFVLTKVDTTSGGVWDLAGDLA